MVASAGSGHDPVPVCAAARECSTAPAASAMPRCDPKHGLAADYEFHPVLVAERSDDQVRQAIRSFAATFRGEWRWSTRPTTNCRLFQLALFDAVGLVDGSACGAGCPALAPLRRLVSKATGRRRWLGHDPGARYLRSIRTAI